VLETSTSLTSAFVVYDPHVLSQATLIDQISTLLNDRDWRQADLPQSRKLWRVPAVFDGPQLDEAAKLAGVKPRDAIAELCQEPLRVLTIGHAPGQPYLGSLTPNWNIPRQTGLTKQVQTGAITVAIRQIVLFSGPSPTGWRQVGRCAFRCFRPELDTPFSLSPGDEVRFDPVDTETFETVRTIGNGGATWEPLQ
jgi:allophanate hydrolase subunit 1